MSQENATKPDAPSTKELEDKKVQEKRDEIHKSLESKQYPSVLKIAFQIITEKDSRLLSDALDAIRQVNSEAPSLIDLTQLQVVVDFLHKDDDIFRASAVLRTQTRVARQTRCPLPMLTSIVTEAASKERPGRSHPAPGSAWCRPPGEGRKAHTRIRRMSRR